MILDKFPIFQITRKSGFLIGNHAGLIRRNFLRNSAVLANQPIIYEYKFVLIIGTGFLYLLLAVAVIIHLRAIGIVDIHREFRIRGIHLEVNTGEIINRPYRKVRPFWYRWRICFATGSAAYVVHNAILFVRLSLCGRMGSNQGVIMSGEHKVDSRPFASIRNVLRKGLTVICRRIGAVRRLMGNYNLPFRIALCCVRNQPLGIFLCRLIFGVIPQNCDVHIAVGNRIMLLIADIKQFLLIDSFRVSVEFVVAAYMNHIGSVKRCCVEHIQDRSPFIIQIRGLHEISCLHAEGILILCQVLHNIL